ncbi:MAG: hypothetical protein JWO94_162 [Verrucomicrobiaceae bacterium]|nr:hypothetical protein [Verrucomicrobiaceae bacterium]
MLFALLTAFFFACSGVCGQRSSSLAGPVKANFLRLIIASLIMAGVTLAYGGVDLLSPAASRLYLSGVVGFGLGDMALFFALPRLGARLTLLINLCTAPLFGSLGDYLLLGTRLQPVHGLVCTLILCGVALALAPGTAPATRAHSAQPRLPGILAALMAGFGQGTGATLSRYAHAAEAAAGSFLPSAVETCLRVVPGMIAVGLFWALLHLSRKTRQPTSVGRPLTARAMVWIAANALCGAVIGVTCFQHALMHASSAVVLSVTATTPILIMPMTFYSEFDHPSLRSIGGATIAVSGVVLLKLLV